MSNIKVDTGGSKPLDLQLNAQNQLNSAELSKLASALGMDYSDLDALLSGVAFTPGEALNVETLIDKAVEGVPDSDAKANEVLAKLEALKAQKGEVEKSLKKLQDDLQKESKKSSPNKNKIDQLSSDIAVAKSLLKAIGQEITETNALLKEALKQSSISDAVKAEIKKKADVQDAGKNGDSSFGKSASAPGAYSNIATPNSNSSPDAGKAASPWFDPENPYNGGTVYDFNPMAMAMTGFMDDATLSAWDMIGEQKKKQQMMMLFFYYARMAMTGDLNAMYQFMRFIGFVICRDKALQNTWLGTKLIELQETSRKATEKLLNLEVGEDLESQTAWQKELQKIKSEEGVVATSQKLITQMMEEFTQLSEMMTNMQKSLLDVNGKVMSNLSVWR